MEFCYFASCVAGTQVAKVGLEPLRKTRTGSDKVERGSYSNSDGTQNDAGKKILRWVESLSSLVHEDWQKGIGT
jgi:hypothetical protein